MVERIEVTVRPLEESDIAVTAEIFFRAVHLGAAEAYDDKQRSAWAPAIPDIGVWAARLKPQTVFVATAGCSSDRPIGFVSVNGTGLVDLAFVDPDWSRCGVGGLLHAAMLQWARARGMASLTTEASLIARPFFERHGWTVDKQQTVHREGVALTNFRMSLSLNP